MKDVLGAIRVIVVYLTSSGLSGPAPNVTVRVHAFPSLMLAD